MIVARSADSDAMKAQHFVIHPAMHNQTGMYSTKAHNGANDFTLAITKNIVTLHDSAELENAATRRHRF